MPPTDELILYGTIAGGGTVVLGGLGMMVARFYRQVEQGHVLIINTLKSEPVVTFTGGVVLPIIHRAEVMDMSLKTVDIDRRGKEGLICRDNIRADIKVAFFVRVNRTREDVLKVAQAIGCERASDVETLKELFEAKFSEALKTVGKQMDFEALYTMRQEFKDEIVKVIGQDLNGYTLEDVAIDFLEQTPLEILDPSNVLDSVGIKKITQITTVENIATEDLRQNERMLITKRRVEADEAVFALERQRAKAEEEQQREIATIRAREHAQAELVRQEEHARAEMARIRAEEEIFVNEQNKLRQIEVAQKNRERVVLVETERVSKDQQLEALLREREVELRRIDKEKAIEAEKKAIADVIRTRIVVEKTVAQEEEAIKDLRVVAEATRTKDARVIAAEAEAQERLVKDMKAAEVAAEVAKFAARERLTLADVELEAADRIAKSKVRIAEGTQAEAAAEGLARARVLEAEALAQEKQGMATVRVREADALAIEKQGVAQAAVVREQMVAEATGAEQKGLAAIRVQEAEALAIQKRGEAEALAIQERLFAEARGLAEKAESMKALDGVGREHEEFRLEIEKDKEVALAEINIRQSIALAQAEVLGKALANADFKIVGGDGEFFERFVRSLSFGTGVDAAIDSSEKLQGFFKNYLDGSKDLAEDLKEVLSKPGATQDVQNLAAAALLARTAKVTKPESKD